MPFFVFKSHVIPTGDFFSDKVHSWYLKGLVENGVLPSTFEIKFKIKKVWKREDIWNECTIAIEVPNRSVQTQAILSDSIDQSWLDKKPESKKKVLGTLNYSDKKCGICLERYGDKIRLQDCNCLFHVDCIETWTQYGNDCPKCLKGINMIEMDNKTCNEKENEKKKLH
tara:strand:+ start:299 stop:805 length:507 start_codon:yes stop_codon:yes gene_type:complete